MSEKVVVRVADLTSWLVDDVKWDRGSASVCCERRRPVDDAAAAAAASENDADACTAPTSVGSLDMRDVVKEKQLIGQPSSFSTFFLVLLSFTHYYLVIPSFNHYYLVLPIIT